LQHVICMLNHACQFSLSSFLSLHIVCACINTLFNTGICNWK
jgi:hypothetical protein